MTHEPTGQFDRSYAENQRQRILESFRQGESASQSSPTPAIIPERLFHYTTIDGLVGITKAGALWASDVRFMNDSTELTYATDLIAGVVAEVFDDVANEELRNVLPDRPQVANIFAYGRRPFIACFCEHGDLLSQWRGYGAGAPAASLGLKLNSLVAFDDLPPNTVLRQVIYDETQQKESVRRVVQAWLATAEEMLTEGSGLKAPDLFPYPAIWALEEALVEHHLRFKHPGFAEEREWRLIKLIHIREELRPPDNGQTEEWAAAMRANMVEKGIPMTAWPTRSNHSTAEGVEIKFRTTGLGLVPYVDLPLLDSGGIFAGRLPLWEVVQGPTAHPDLSLGSLSMYLLSRGFDFCTKVTASTIPLRS